MMTNLTNKMVMDQVLSPLSVRAFCTLVLNDVMIESFDLCLVESFLIESQYS